jgi:4,5-DOPA dioxygenase extradiol
MPKDVKGILIISAHWQTNGTKITSNSPDQKTVFDIGGFPPELYQIKYKAQGSITLAKTIKSYVSSEIQLDSKWGLDHGAWTLLKFLYPKPEVPILQMSLDRNKSIKEHYELAQSLRALRDEGVLIITSGNIVHNLQALKWGETKEAYNWARDFDNRVHSAVMKRKFDIIIEPDFNDPTFKLAVPTLEHYLPLIYHLGFSYKEEDHKTIIDGFQYASLSMRSYRAGVLS